MSQINVVILDGTTYRVSAPSGGPAKYKKNRVPILELDVGGTGLPIVTETGLFHTEYTATLHMTFGQLATLEASYNKRLTTGTPPQNLLDFVGIEGDHWNPAASGAGTLNTGVLFPLRSEIRTIHGLGWDNANHYDADITIVVNSTA